MLTKHEGLCLAKYKHSSEVQNVLNDKRRISFHKSQQQLTLLNENWSFC